MTIMTNDTTALIPVTAFDNPILEFDFPGLEIGVAEYAEAQTGCTVFHFPDGAKTAVDIRGGTPGVTTPYEWCHAICLAGGSLYGLEAASGVHAELFARKGYSFDDPFPLVNGAILFDFGRRESRVYPDKALGRAALRSAKQGWFPLGSCGAGRSASIGGTLYDEWVESSGQGAAFRQIGNVKIAVFMVVNALGSVRNRNGEIVRGNRNPAMGEHPDILDELERIIAGDNAAQPKQGNTTLTVLVTNLKLDGWRLKQLGRQVHSSLARVIQPFHTIDDGDVFYAVSTGAVEDAFSVTHLGMLASELAWDAALRAVGAS